MPARLLLILLSLLLSACGSWVGEEEEVVDPPAELFDINTSLEVDELWDRDTGSGTDDQYLLLQPVVNGNRIYIANANRRVLAVNAENGRNLWSWELETGGGFFSKNDRVFITGGPGYGEGSVLVGTSDGDVIALDPESGEEQWRTRVSSEVLSAPQKENNIVVVRTLDGRVFGLSGNNGRRLWSYEKTVPNLTLRGTSTPTINDGIIISGFDGGTLSAIDLASGRLVWESSISTPSGRTELERMVDIDSKPIVAGAIVYAVTFQGQLAAMTVDTGRTIWNRQLSSYTGFAVDDDFLYISDDDSNIWAFDRFNGGSLWRNDSLLHRQVTAPAVIGDYLVIGDFEGYLHWLDKYTGEFVARQRISRDRIIVSPVIADNTVYVFSSDGELAALTYQ